MLNKLLMGLIWLYYVALIYTGLINPDHAYMGALDIATIVYLTLHIPLNALMGFVATIIVLGKESFENHIEKEIKEKPELVAKFKNDIHALESKKFKAMLVFNRLLTLAAMTSAFVMDFYWLSAIMLVGYLGGIVFVSAIKHAVKAVKNA